jgi:hypothetical protein
LADRQDLSKTTPWTKRPGPGTRIIVRHEEWLVKKIDRTRSGARHIAVIGLPLYGS